MKKYILFLIITIVCVLGFQIEKVEAKCGSDSRDIGNGYCQYYNCGNVYDRNGNSPMGWPSCSGNGSCNPGSPSGYYRSGDYFYWTCTSWFQGVSVGRPTSCQYYSPQSAPGACGTYNNQTSMWPAGSNWCSPNTTSPNTWSQVGDESNGGVWKWTCPGTNGGATSPVCQFTQQCQAGAVLVNGSCVTSSCGTANNTPSFDFPSSNLCGAGNTASNQTPSTDNSPHTWNCAAGTNSPVSCQAPRCSTGNKYCSTTNSCIANSSCCGTGAGGTCASGSTCTVSGGYGSCVSDNPSGTCSFSNPNGIDYALSPSIVDTPDDDCSLSWNLNYSNSNLTSGAACVPALSCRLNGASTYKETAIGTSSINLQIDPGTYTLSCTDSSGEVNNRSFQCKVSPDYGEF